MPFNTSKSQESCIADSYQKQWYSTSKLRKNTWSNFKWDEQFRNFWVKCCRGFSVIRRLHLDGATPNLIMMAYMGLIYSQISFCWPVICDLPAGLFIKIRKQYQLVLKWCDIRKNASLAKRLDTICLRMTKILSRITIFIH